MFDFDEVVMRKGTDCTKWDQYGDKDIIPLWVADMDFKTVPEVKEAIVKRAEHGIYGYTVAMKDLNSEIISFVKRHHATDIEAKDILLVTGVVHGLHLALSVLTGSDDKVLVMMPSYPPLVNTPRQLKREVVMTSFVNEDEDYKVDLEDFEKKLKDDPKIKCFILCNPHNPTGHLFSKEEIESLLAICYKYGVYVISDEIHGDLIMPGHTHHSALGAKAEYLDNVVVLCAPTKTFNLAGIKVSYILCKNEKIMKMLQDEAKAVGIASINIFGYTALEAAYRYGDEWLKECNAYIFANFKYLEDYLKENLPLAKTHVPDATYLAWVNLNAFDLPLDFVDRLKEEGGVHFNPGVSFDERYQKYIRVNCATPRANLKEGLDRLVRWLKNNQII